MFKTFSREDFPLTVSEEESLHALGVIREYVDPQNDIQTMLLERPAIRVQMGRLLTAAVNPHLNVIAGTQLSQIDDGTFISDARMHRAVYGEHVMVRPIVGNGSTQIMVYGGESVNNPLRINASLPFSEYGLRYGTSQFFIVNHDLASDVYVNPDDARFPEQLRTVLTTVVDAIDAGTPVAPDYRQ